ncbi:UbiA family prenyltransferase, partial [Nonomuraea lactucae]|uniref:UbiA family prenyltransferase n=1 Tax=Nonomuraea lactucae TaxID=2249762 RepID=UPI0013B472C1
MKPGRLQAFVELVRAPAALSVPGDLLAGAAAAGRPVDPGLVAGSACLYWAGMALNDYADRDVDARERPERPIPSGRVSPGLALAAGAGL